MIVTRRRFGGGVTAVAASAAFGAALSPRPVRAQSFQYKFASNLPAAAPLNVRMMQCWDAVAKETGGRLVVTTHPNNELGGDTAALTQLRSGAIQFFTLDGGILENVVPLAAIQSIGFAFEDDAQAFRAFDGALGDDVRKAIVAAGLYVAPKMLGNGMRQVTSSKGPVTGPSSFDGFKIRTPPGALWIDLFRSLGASPTPINGSELYSALQTKIVDGQENPISAIYNVKLYEVQKYLSITNHMWSAYHVLGNMDAWKALPPDVRAIVERNLTKYALLQRADNAAQNRDRRASLLANGMIENVPDRAALRAKLATSGFYRKWHAAFGDEAWALLERTSGKLG